MTKAELLEMVQALPDDIVFLVSSDQEGNSFRKANFSVDEYAYQDGYEWQIVHEDDLDEYDEGELVKVAVFW